MYISKHMNFTITEKVSFITMKKNNIIFICTLYIKY